MYLFFIYLITNFIFSNDILITSNILDKNNNPISNVNINCGTTGTYTDKDGYFSIICDDNDNIDIKHIKYKKLSLISNNISSFIVLSDENIIVKPIIIYGQLSHLEDKSFSTQITDIENIKKTSYKHFQDINHYISNFNYSQGTSRPRYFQVRGLGELSQFSGEGAPHFYVGYSIDNIDLSGIGMIGNLYDIKQIEIFKGPQSSIFGQNSMGGQINIISLEPKNYQYVSNNFSISNNNSYSYDSYYTNKINNNISFSILLSKYLTDGHITNKQLTNSILQISHDTNSKDESLIKFKINYLKNNLIFKITTLLSDLNNRYDVWSPDNNGYETYTNYRGRDIQETNAISLYIKKNNNLYDIISISSYCDANIIYSYDSDWGNNEFWSNPPYEFNNYYYGYYSPYNYNDITFRKKINKSQEFRIIDHRFKKTTIITGFIYTTQNEKDIRDGWLFAGDAININSEFDIKKTALYWQITKDINEKVNLNLSIRKDINKTSNKIFWTSLYGETENGNNKILNNNLIGYNIKVNYKINNNISFQSIISTGYKSSGINMTPNLPSEYRNYTNEYLYNYEIGINTQKNKLKTNISLFYMYRNNPQLRLFYQHIEDNPNSFDYATFNSDNGYIYGMEIENMYNINNKININFSIGLLETYISSFEYLGIEYGDREQAHAPSYTYNITIDYKVFEFIYFNLSFHGMDKFYFDDQYEYTSNCRDLIDFSFNYKKNNYQVSIWSKNFLNEKYEVRGYTFGLEPPNYTQQNYKSYGSPLEYGITLGYSL